MPKILWLVSITLPQAAAAVGPPGDGDQPAPAELLNDLVGELPGYQLSGGDLPRRALLAVREGPQYPQGVIRLPCDEYHGRPPLLDLIISNLDRKSQVKLDQFDTVLPFPQKPGLLFMKNAH